MRRLLDGSFSIAATYTQGTRFLGATKDESSGGRKLKAQFVKFSLDSSYYKPLNLCSYNFGFMVQLHGQSSPHNLYSNESLSLGGRSTVRGFKESKICGDTGGYLRTELNWMLNTINNKVTNDLLGTVQAFISYDLGWIHRDKSDPFERGNLKGGSIGMRTSGGLVFGEIMVTRAFAMPRFSREEGTLVFFKFGANF